MTLRDTGEARRVRKLHHPAVVVRRSALDRDHAIREARGDPRVLASARSTPEGGKGDGEEGKRGEQTEQRDPACLCHAQPEPREGDV